MGGGRPCYLANAGAASSCVSMERGPTTSCLARGCWFHRPHPVSSRQPERRFGRAMTGLCMHSSGNRSQLGASERCCLLKIFANPAITPNLETPSQSQIPIWFGAYPRASLFQIPLPNRDHAAPLLAFDPHKIHSSSQSGRPSSRGDRRFGRSLGTSREEATSQVVDRARVLGKRSKGQRMRGGAMLL